MSARIRLVGARRSYRRGDEEVHALRGVDLELDAGGLYALTGPSGSGKSTLLLVMAGWEHLDNGVVEVVEGAESVGAASSHAPARLQWDQLSVVPQALGLLDDLTVAENVLLPARLGGRSRDAYPANDDHISSLFESLDIERLRFARGNELSLGEQQRVAVARALVLHPIVVLADEPSTHQDADHGRAVFEALRGAADRGAIVVVASHDPEGLRYADRVLAMSDGELSEIARQ
jgi:ABC-type lipoprotein export system ATPase subunit